MAKGRVTSYKDAIDKLYAEKATLSGQISRTPEELILGETGYFVSTVDGYESTLDMDGVRSLSPEAIEGIIEKPVNGECDSTVIGKIVDSYKWKAAAVMDSKQVISVTEGSTVELYVGTGGMTVSAVVELVEKYDNDKNVVVFAGDELNSALSSARTEHFKLLVDSYNGIRISSQAIHFDVDNNVGVYIIDGNTAKFVRIKRIYSGDGYVIAEDTTDSTGYLSLYDRIIKDGKDVYDGKVL